MARTVLVTGGTRGIGRAVADRLVAAGDRVVVTGRPTALGDRARPAAQGDRARPAAQGDRARPGAVGADRPGAHASDRPGAHASRRPGAPGIDRVGAVERVDLDLEDVGSIQALADRFPDGVDVLVNNAGAFAAPTPAADVPLAEHAAAWHRNLAVNLVGAALLVTALEPRLLAGGAVVNVGSIGAEYAGNAYSVAKAAVQAWSAGLAERLGPRGITVNAVAPGYVEGTDLFGGPVAERRRAALVARTLTGRPGTPEDVAALVEFLASPGARQITAQTLHLDGGAFTTR
jgi:3-oxoacyl-[acyl-carrier protein] reductase